MQVGPSCLPRFADLGGHRRDEAEERGFFREPRRHAWAAMHFALNGDAASAVLFGALLLLAFVGPRSIDAKRQRAFGERWHRFADITSNVPFAAIAQGRNSLNLAELGAWRIAVGAAIYVVLLLTHRWLFGVSPLP